MTLRDLSRKYCKKPLKALEPPDIVIYNPSETDEPSQQQLDVEDEAYVQEAVKKPVQGVKGKQFISREAEEEEEEIQADPEPTVKKAKKSTCTCCCSWYYCFCL